MGLHQQYATNKELEVDGRWFPYPQANGDLIEILLARSGGANSPYKRALRKILRKFKGAQNTAIENYPPAMKDVCDAMGEHVLIGWRTTKAGETKSVPKAENEKGTMIAYSAREASKMLVSLPELRLDVQGKSGDYTNYQDSDPEEIEKNSSPPSNGG